MFSAAETVQPDPATDPAPETTAEETEPPVEREAPGWLVSKETVYKSDGSLQSEITYEYDTEGNLIRKTDYSAEKTNKLVTEFKYNPALNQTIQYDSIDDDIVQITSMHYFYDDWRDLTKIIYSDEYGTEIGREEFAYDEIGNVIKHTAFQNGIMEWREDISYDENGYVLSAKTCDGNGEILKWLENSYDETGRKIKEIDYDSEGNVSLEILIEYDRNGNISQMVTTSSSGTPIWVKYYYDDNENLITKTRHYGNSSARLFDKTVYEYVYIP